MPELSLNFQTDRFVLLFLILLVFLGWSYLLYRRTEAPIKRGTKALLIALRSLAVLAVIFALWQPLLTFTEKLEKSPRIAVLIDTSASMNLSDGSSPTSGEEVLRSRLKVAREVLRHIEQAQLPSRAMLDYWIFSDSLERLVLELDSLKASGLRTAVGEALNRLKEAGQNQNLTAAVIISDGDNNSGVDPLTVVPGLGVPVYAVGVGSPRAPLDVAIGELNFPEVVYAEMLAEVEFTVRVTGPGEGRMPVLLKSGATLYGQTELLIERPGEQTGQIQFTPDQIGTRFFQLQLPPQHGEKVTKNNYRSFSIEVLKSKLKVLLVSSRPDWEFGFLKRTLQENDKLEVKPVVYGPAEGFVLGSFPPRLEALAEHEILVFVDPGLRQLRGREEMLRDYLRAGHSILFLLGRDFSASGAFSLLEELLPLDFPSGQEAVAGPFSVALTPDGLLHPVTRLSEVDRENRELWREVPPFEFIVPGQLKSGRASPGGVQSLVLLTSPLAVKPPREAPALVVSERYGGKIMILTVFPLWRWDFLPHGFEQQEESYSKFFNNAIRWLASPLKVERMNVYPERKVYSYGEEISILGKFYDESFQPLGGVESRLEVSGGGAAAEVEKLIVQLIEKEAGRYKATISSLPPGKYAFAAEASREGEKLGQFKGAFEVEGLGLEEASLAADLELMSRLGELSGGRFFAPEAIDSLFPLLDFESKVLEVKTEVQLWNQPWLLGAAVIFLALEWIIRKRYQLS